VGYNHATWFFGTGDIPNWTGFMLGLRIVDEYKTAHPGTSAASLVNVAADVLRPL
jgi:uncharacterized protein YjaZ